MCVFVFVYMCVSASVYMCVCVCVCDSHLTSHAVNMDPADDGCTVSNPEMVVMAAVVNGDEGGACVREEEPEVKGEEVAVCCCCETAMIRGEGDSIERGGEPTDDAPAKITKSENLVSSSNMSLQPGAMCYTKASSVLLGSLQHSGPLRLNC